MHVELGDRIALTDQPEELAFGRRQRLVRHHVQQTDVQLADVLVQRTVRRQHIDALLSQAFESR